MLGNISKTIYIFSIIAILFIGFSNHIIPDAEAKDLGIDTDCIDGIFVIIITDKEGNPLSNVRVSTQDSISSRDVEERFYTDMDGKVTIDSSSNLGYVSFSKGGYNDKSISSKCELPIEETCSYKQSYMPRTNTDLNVVHHWPIAAGWYIPGYEDQSAVIIGDIVNLSEFPLTNIVITIQVYNEGIIREEPSSWYPIKKILRPGESSPFVIVPDYWGFDSYEIWVSNYQYSCDEVVQPESIVDEIILGVDNQGEETLSFTCSNKVRYYDDLRIIYVGYNEANYIDTISIGSSLGILNNIADCLTKGSVDATPFLHYVQDNNLELFTIKGPNSLVFNVEEMEKEMMFVHFDDPERLGILQTNIFSKFYPDSLRPKYMDLNEIRVLAEKHGTMRWDSTTTPQLEYDNNYYENDPDNIDSSSTSEDSDARYISENGVSFQSAGKLEPSPNVPEWIRNNAKWWVEGTIGDSDFTSGIQYLIKEGIIKIPETVSTGDGGSQEIPGWIKNNADWWAQGLISDDDFVKGIQYLVEQGIIQV